MSSSFEAGVVRAPSHGAPVEQAEPVRLQTPELRTGVWTRFGGSNVLGDAVTEETLSALAESTRQAARSQGYAVGWADGQRAAREQARVEAEAAEQDRVQAEQQRQHEHRAAIAALELAAARIHDAVEGMSARVEEQASTLAWDLTRELVGLELRSVAGPDVVRRALQLTPTEAIVKLHLHPDHVSDLTAADLAELADHGVSVAGDPSLAWGDALAETADHVIDLRVRTALDRLREVLA